MSMHFVIAAIVANVLWTPILWRRVHRWRLSKDPRDLELLAMVALMMFLSWSPVWLYSWAESVDAIMRWAFAMSAPVIGLGYWSDHMQRRQAK